MFGLMTMLFSTLGATGMGSLLKIFGGIVDRFAAAKEAAEKRELLKELAGRDYDVEFQKSVFGQANEQTSAHARATRRIIAIIGMCNFAAISILCTLWPGADLVTFTLPEQREAISILWGFVTLPSKTPITTSITSGHIALASLTSLSAIIGFYFTPGGRK